MKTKSSSQFYKGGIAMHLRKCFVLTIFILFSVVSIELSAQVMEQPVPRLIEKDGRHALFVDGQPFLILGGQGHNSSAWPSSMLASLDGVALESVGLDIMNSQPKNNFEPTFHNVPCIAIRDNADDFLKEMTLAAHPPSGTKYIHDGILPKSQGVLEHWDNDLSRKYSRNLDPKSGKGIELIYKPM